MVSKGTIQKDAPPRGKDGLFHRQNVSAISFARFDSLAGAPKSDLFAWI